jgi:hypothetical protein
VLRHRVAPRPRAAACIAFLLLAVTALAVPVEAAAGAGDTEVVIARRLAEARSQAGVAAVSRSSDLDAVARDWSRRQAADGQMKHNPDLAAQVQPARAWYENVGTLSGVPSVMSYSDAGTRLHRMWMDSSGHRANILRTPLTDVGIGVVASGDRIYATVVFRDQGDAASAPEPEPEPEPTSEPQPKPAPSPEPEPEGKAKPAPAASVTTSGEGADAAATDDPEPEPEPEPDRGLAPPPEEATPVAPGDGAQRLDRRVGADRPQVRVEASDLVDPEPRGTAPEAADAPSPPPLATVADAATGLPVGDAGTPALPVTLGLGTIVGAVAVGAARSRRSGR